MSDNDRRCATCVNWMPVEPGAGSAEAQTDPSRGECHRYAPRPRVVDRGGVRFPAILWPLTEASDLCGEWFAGDQRRRSLRTERPTEQVESLETTTSPSDPSTADLPPFASPRDETR